MRILLLLLILITSISGCKREKTSRKPNIVVIIADDLGWADVGYNGARFYETPHINQLAAEGMVFNRFYPGAANCAPSRATLLTGMYTPRHDVYIPQGLARGGEVSKMRYKVPTQGQDSTFNTFHVSINTVEPEIESLAEMLKKEGYISARLGKWHIGDDNQGFDVNSANGEIGFTTNKNGDEARYYNDVHVAEQLTDAAVQFIEDNREKPFFLYLSHWEVHGPMAAQQKRIDYYKNKLNSYKEKKWNPVYAAETEQVDLSVGRVMQKLRELKLEKNTIVVFTSDNGGVSAVTSNEPLRAGKGTFYEGGIRVPFCIKWPGVIKAGTETDFPINGIDFMPTFAEIAAAPLPEDQPVDGISFLPLLQNPAFEKDRNMYFHFPLYLGGGREDAVLPAYDGTENYWRAVPSSVIISGNWKLIHYYEYGRYELYNLEEDISEEHDLSESEPEKAKQLLQKLNDWVEKTGAPVPDVLND